MAEAAIVTRGLTKRYGDLLAVDRLDLEIRRGEVFGLLGPNGAGKTTTILMLLGLSEPTAGEARVVGLDPMRNPLEVKRVVGYLPDDVGFYPSLTGRENLRFTARLNRLPRAEAEERIAELIQDVGLTPAADRRAGAYSRGMRQRLGIADALVKRPEVLILDEPTIGIDPEGAAEVLDLIRSLARDRGVTLLLSSHLLHQVQSVCDRVGIFVAGRMIALGTVDQLAAEVAGGTVQLEVGAEGDPAEVRTAIEATRGVREVAPDEQHPGQWLVTTEGDLRAALARKLARAGLPPVHLRLRGAELDELYRRYFHEEREGVRAG